MGGERVFLVVASNLWINPPFHIRDAQSPKYFKTPIKTYLFLLVQYILAFIVQAWSCLFLLFYLMVFFKFIRVHDLLCFSGHVYC